MSIKKCVVGLPRTSLDSVQSRQETNLGSRQGGTSVSVSGQTWTEDRRNYRSRGQEKRGQSDRKEKEFERCVEGWSPGKMTDKGGTGNSEGL